MHFYEVLYIILPFLNFKLINSPKNFLGKRGSAFAFKAIAFNYANIINQVFSSDIFSILENSASHKKIKKNRKIKRWAPASLLHLAIAAICIGSSPVQTKLRPTVNPGLLFSASILGCWWTALKAPHALSWSWDPIECALYLSVLTGVCSTHVSGRICNSGTRSFIISIAPRLIRGGLLRTGHHAKFNSSKKVYMFNSVDYFNFSAKRYSILTAVFLSLYTPNASLPMYKRKNIHTRISKLGPTTYTHIGVLLTLIAVGWSSWSKSGLFIGGLLFRIASFKCLMIFF